MCYNSFDLEEDWKMRIAQAEHKAMLAYQTRDLKSPEAQMLERLLRGVRYLFTVRPLPNFRLMHYASQEK